MKNLVLAFVLVMIVSLMASDTFATGIRSRRRISNAELRAIRRAQIRAQIRRDALRFDSFNDFDSCNDGFSDFRVRRRGIGFSFGY